MSKPAPPKKVMPTWMNFLIGGTSGIISICIVQPNDLLKTRMQLAGPAGKSETMLSMGRKIVAAEGFKGLYTGLSAACFRQATYSTGRLGSFNTLFDYYKGIMAICIVQPNDLIKTRMQLAGPAGKSETMLSMGKKVVAAEGFKGLYTGLSAACFRQATYSTGRLGSFNTFFDYYKGKYGQPPALGTKVGMGMVSGGIGAFIGTPAEVALIRMTADGRLPPEKRRNYTNVVNALSRIIKEEGVGTLWTGAGATVTRAMVVNGAQLGTYAQAREMLLPAMGDNMTLHFTASMIAGLITSAASLPVDIVKTRVQNSAKGANQVTVLMDVIKKEGVLALWSGFLPTYLKIGPHTVLTFIFMEKLNALYYSM